MRTYLVYGEIEVVAIEFLCNSPNLIFGIAFLRHQDAVGDDHCALHPLWVVVGADCGGRGPRQSLLAVAIGEKCAGRDAHCRAVAEGIVRLGISGQQPFIESTAISSFRVFMAVFIHNLSEWTVRQNGIGHGHGHHSVIGKVTVCVEEVKLCRAVVVKFKSRPYNVANNCSYHTVYVLFVYNQ